MTRDEIITALRCHCDAIETGVCPKDKCPSFERPARYKCAGVVCGEAADLIENQLRRLEPRTKANDCPTDAISRRGEQREEREQGMAQLAKAVAVKEEQSELRDMKNELCQYCGKYKKAREGACDGCKWRDM